ncbi:MAG: hypothetical protein Q7S85_00610 [Rugosibacter sp.]|nr:hypothetical protein [Rugosibacter sp.]
MNRADDLRVDWFRILDDLKRQGFSLYALEAQVAIPKSTLIGYKQGAEPNHMTGERLIAFWRQAMGRPRELVPMISRHDWRA